MPVTGHTRQFIKFRPNEILSLCLPSFLAAWVCSAHALTAKAEGILQRLGTPIAKVSDYSCVRDGAFERGLK